MNSFTLPQLEYDYNSLEPYIDSRTMEIHHTKHHQGYVNNLNAALAKYPDLNYGSLEEVLLQINSLPKDIQNAVKNNGGGHYNHTLFWKILSPNKNQKPTGELLNKINQTFSSYDNFKAEFIEKGKTHFGSGWVWLILNGEGKLEIISLPNQDVPLSIGTPLIAIDLWEHAYYLNYQNRRPDYLNAIWEVINWRYVEQLFENA